MSGLSRFHTTYPVWGPVLYLFLPTSWFCQIFWETIHLGPFATKQQVYINAQVVSDCSMPSPSFCLSVCVFKICNNNNVSFKNAFDTVVTLFENPTIIALICYLLSPWLGAINVNVEMKDGHYVHGTLTLWCLSIIFCLLKTQNMCWFSFVSWLTQSYSNEVLQDSGQAAP